MKNAFGRFIAIVLGCCLGTMVFLTVVVFVIGNPMEEWLGSTLGIFFSQHAVNLSPATWSAASELLHNGIITTPDELTSKVIDIYGTMIQVIVGVFALFGILSFFAVRWQSIQQAETFAEGKIEKVFSSEDFKKRLSDAASKANDLQVEPLQESLANLSHISERITALENHIAAQAPENEPEAKEDSN